MDEQFYTRETIEAVKAAKNVAVLPLAYQIKFCKVFFREVNEENRKQIFEHIVIFANPEVQWQEVDLFFEECFRENHELQPGTAVHLCMQARKLELYLKPFLLKIAQKVKQRIGYHLRKNLSGTKASPKRST
ncbi:MAG: hypothetical protein C4581_00145 [Nitrospiraceae bacterium]|nr:MAG: hypothetical protein C4581_00145 [Nitrospiraceae bacterium]